MKHGNCCGHCRQYLRGAYWGCTIAGNREIHDDDSAAMVESEEGNKRRVPISVGFYPATIYWACTRTENCKIKSKLEVAYDFLFL